MTTPSLRSRVLFIDLLKAVAAQLIVFHHLAWFGPLGGVAMGGGPAVEAAILWLADYGRYAVAVFIVTSGFLVAQFLPQQGLPPGATVVCLIRDRYIRLAAPFAVAMLLAVLANLLTRQWLDDEMLGASPHILQWLAHLLLLHGLLDVESLSAGAWYVAIDFQLYALMVLLLWLGRRLASADFWVPLPVFILAAVSLLHFNRDARFDDTALYFFGTYGLGVASGWAIRSHWRWAFLGGIAVLGGLALTIEFRGRIALAVVTALLLGCSRLHLSHRQIRVVHYLGGTSYALFLVHFPVYLLVTAIAGQWVADRLMPVQALIALAVSWLLGMLVADRFHHWVELPVTRWHKRKLHCSRRIAG